MTSIKLFELGPTRSARVRWMLQTSLGARTSEAQATVDDRLWSS